MVKQLADDLQVEGPGMEPRKHGCVFTYLISSQPRLGAPTGLSIEISQDCARPSDVIFKSRESNAP